MKRDLQTKIQFIKGVGPKRAEVFSKLGIRTVSDLLRYLPRRHEDRSRFKEIQKLKIGDLVTVQGKVLKASMRYIKRLKILDVVISDGTGLLNCVWFNQPYLKNVFQEGRTVVLNGRIERYKGFQMKSPEYEVIDEEDQLIHTGRIVPIYPLKEGLKQKNIRKLLFTLLHEQNETLPEYLEKSLIQKYQFLDLTECIRQIHFPENFEMLERARNRIVFEEFYVLQNKLAFNQLGQQKEKNHFKVQEISEQLEAFYQALPFQLTEDQLKALEESINDILGDHPMNRLIQGDVGSGKTVVALALLFLMMRNDHQGVFLVPTEILAEQHYQSLLKILVGDSSQAALLLGGTKKKERETVLEKLRSGEVKVLVGTHAVLQPDLDFQSLGLVIIDEQHKFGVRQRAQLLGRKKRPHLLVMTATPIPRTLSITVFGDLELSLIKQMPKGRKPIKTHYVTAAKEKKMFEFLKEKVARGEQVYILFPLVQETEKLDLKAATEEYEKLKTDVFPEQVVGLIHGKLKRNEKEEIMRDFKEGKITILVATSVVEVGIDNPNATCIVIEHVERFGLSQLHQFRGRVGRGEKQSYCFLRGILKTPESKQRVKIMTETTDGFEIAEQDLKLRGAGDYLGTRQSGLPMFLMADIYRDQRILKAAREEAQIRLKSDKLTPFRSFFSPFVEVSTQVQN